MKNSNMWTTLVILLMPWGMETVKAIDMETQSSVVMDDFANEIDMMVGLSVSSSEFNQTTDSIEEEDVENENLTFTNGTDGNWESTNGTVMTTEALMNPECLQYTLNPGWHLVATKAAVRHYACVCYKICPTDKQIKDVRDRIIANRTVKGVFEGESFTFYFVFSLYVFVIPVGTLCNLLVIVGLLGIMKDKSVVNRFVVSLAVADLFMSMFITPIKLLYLVRVMDHMKETWLCKIMLYIRQVAQAETIAILTIIAFERYYAICHPLKAKFRCSMKRCHLLILISWLVSFAISLPTVISARYQDDRTGVPICLIYYDNHRFLQAHCVYFLIVLLIVPTCLMTYAYSNICFALWKSTKKAAELTNQDRKVDKKAPSDVQSRIKVIKTMIALLLVFEVCWGPRLLFNAIQFYYFEMIPLTRYYSDMIVELFANGHSLINPLLFIAFSQSFRQALRKRLPSWCCRSSLKGAASGRSSVASSGLTVSTSDGPKSTATNGSSDHI